MQLVCPEMEAFLELHKNQLESSAVSKIFWQPLERKLREQTLDAGRFVGLMRFDYDGRDRLPREPPFANVVIAEDGLSDSDPNSIFLIDHAWTFRPNIAREQLRAHPALVSRLSNMMNVPEDVESVMSEVWRYAQTYSLESEEAEDRAPIWYVPDEVGAAVLHSDTPNVRLIPFVHLPDKITYSILFPLENIPPGTMLTRDYAEGPETDPDTRRALLLPWNPDTSFLNFPFQQEEPPESFFTEFRMAEFHSSDIEANIDAVPRPIKVYSEYSEVSKSLKHPDFTLVSTPEEADILWLLKHYRDFTSLGCNRFINQFPCENVLTVKDLLSVVCRRSTRRSEGGLDGGPAWLPTTYNLKTELPQFVSYFERRHDREMDNHWICKPWNLARGMDTYISQELNFILRLPWTGPKIAQKYIEDPVLFNRPEIGKVKFDVRYVILLKSVQPLEAYVYKEFFVRFANLPFQLSYLDEYERHFTVMNYENPERLLHMKCEQFVPEFEQQYEQLKWMDIEADILVALRGALEAAISKPSPQGIPHNPQSRAVYAADVMLAWEGEEGAQKVQPKLLEINWMPDCQRACLYYPSFFDDIFSTLFLGQRKNVISL